MLDTSEIFSRFATFMKLDTFYLSESNLGRCTFSDFKAFPSPVNMIIIFNQGACSWITNPAGEPKPVADLDHLASSNGLGDNNRDDDDDENSFPTSPSLF